MNEYEALRREIEVRLQRETAYKAAQVGANKPDYEFMTEEIRKNDEVIALIGKFLLSKGSEWEKVYQEKYNK